MFGDKCSRCSKKVSKKFDFCPTCGLNLSGAAEDAGFLGKSDLENLGIKLPFGVKAMLKPLMKEFNKQMIELEKEMKKQQPLDKDPKNNKVVKSFSIHLGAPGQKPVKINSDGPINAAQMMQDPNEEMELPKIDNKKLEKVKNLPRKEPETNIRRLSDHVIYEISLPGVKGLNDINITILEDAIEVKAISKKIVFVKSIDVALPIIDYDFEKEILTLELEMK